MRGGICASQPPSIRQSARREWTRVAVIRTGSYFYATVRVRGQRISVFRFTTGSQIRLNAGPGTATPAEMNETVPAGGGRVRSCRRFGPPPFLIFES